VSKSVLRSLITLAVCAVALTIPPLGAQAAGEIPCTISPAQITVGQAAAVMGALEKGTRASIEGESLALCTYTGSPYRSGSFQWTALDYTTSQPWEVYANIVQVG
jgi:hypothetical protein